MLLFNYNYIKIYIFCFSTGFMKSMSTDLPLVSINRERFDKTALVFFMQHNLCTISLKNDNMYSFLTTWSKNMARPYKNEWNFQPIILKCNLNNVSFTCMELTIVNIQANTEVFRLTANNPTTHVNPRSGSKTKLLFTAFL